MKNQLVDLILHPARMRILRELAGETLTAQQLSERLPDISQATLYRHINRLLNAGLLSVVEERPVRGTVEKIYSASPRGAQLTAEETLQMSKEEHMRLFTAFVTALLQDFERYLDSTGRPDYAADGVGYRQIKINLSDEEFMQMAAEINAAVLKHYYNPPGAGRRQRLFSTIVMPSGSQPEAPSNPGSDEEHPASGSSDLEQKNDRK